VNKEIKSLYRVYRPKNFGEVIGQQHITRTLQNQIESGKIAHAYLFCGTRGTGKTSVAKIFAREVSRWAPEKDTPQSELDIFEIDAASNNSVQDVREIIEKVKYPPVFAKYKVYIIDEVHMFSGAAFNAFLKTLEEPPSHVIFILCTTEPHKLLPTVQSRCLRFDFRTATTADLEKSLMGILKKENIQADADAIKLLASAGHGSFRDAQSFTETVLSYCGDKKITLIDVCEVIGIIDKKTLRELLNFILANDFTMIKTTCDFIFGKGLNASTLVKDFLEIIRTVFIETKNAALLKIYKVFAELEMNIKTACDVKSLFESACFLSLADGTEPHV